MGEEFIVIILLGIVGLCVLIPLAIAVINSKDTDDYPSYQGESWSPSSHQSRGNQCQRQRALNNQSTQDLTNSLTDIKVAVDNYKLAIDLFKDLIKLFHYETISVGEHETVFKIENDLIVYIGVIKIKLGERFLRFCVLVEELTYNNLFKFNASKFKDNFRNSFYDIEVVFFYSLSAKNSTQVLTQFHKINELVPELKLLERVEKWEGVSFGFVLLKVCYEGETAYTVKYTQQKDLEKFAQKCCSEAERSMIYEERHNPINNIDFVRLIRKIRNSMSQNKLTFTLRGYLSYLCITEKMKDWNCQERGARMIKEALSGGFDKSNWKEYGRFEGKWKSEAFVYELCQEIYGPENVLFQFSPDFLGNQSYDVYLPQIKVAIEYQGKQHFEPVDFFGGQDHFEAQLIRDKRKKKISKENGVTLVYINYDEIISKELIIKKINKAIKK